MKEINSENFRKNHAGVINAEIERTENCSAERRFLLKEPSFYQRRGFFEFREDFRWRILENGGFCWARHSVLVYIILTLAKIKFSNINFEFV